MRVALLTGAVARWREPWCARDDGFGSTIRSGRDVDLNSDDTGISGSSRNPDTHIRAKDSKLWPSQSMFTQLENGLT